MRHGEAGRVVDGDGGGSKAAGVGGGKGGSNLWIAKEGIRSENINVKG